CRGRSSEIGRSSERRAVDRSEEPPISDDVPMSARTDRPGWGHDRHRADRRERRTHRARRPADAGA
ncbi:hypothetical protein, partial [Microbacterium sp.]|uniref:hypothetical protein n=1 Tax=Microbacterium sp. TaxID=51671 RepID=UPI0032218E7C